MKLLGPSFSPSGVPLFETNVGSHRIPQLDRLISKTCFVQVRRYLDFSTGGMGKTVDECMPILLPSLLLHTGVSVWFFPEAVAVNALDSND